MERQGSALILGLSLTGLGIVVALPILFILLQAIFPHLSEGSLSAPFSALYETLVEPRLLGLTGNTVLLGLAVIAGTAAVATPLAVLRDMLRLPATRFWDVLFLIPFMIPPFIGAFSWVLALEP